MLERATRVDPLNGSFAKRSRGSALGRHRLQSLPRSRRRRQKATPGDVGRRGVGGARAGRAFALRSSSTAHLYQNFRPPVNLRPRVKLSTAALTRYAFFILRHLLLLFYLPPLRGRAGREINNPSPVIKITVEALALEARTLLRLQRAARRRHSRPNHLRLKSHGAQLVADLFLYAPTTARAPVLRLGKMRVGKNN
ncbi:hypothetical protein EVAR_89888_1 [Eumeta japonica]|uniref:Uncharacterized protein n=1 Tax=Eumeta variegata TaxID=151549 RepID=A0A4C1YX63_EUMVA|nr:hypothetical protein EVAR_89888_1 [Eumeta japonica]